MAKVWKGRIEHGLNFCFTGNNSAWLKTNIIIIRRRLCVNLFKETWDRVWLGLWFYGTTFHSSWRTSRLRPDRTNELHIRNGRRWRCTEREIRHIQPRTHAHTHTRTHTESSRIFSSRVHCRSQWQQVLNQPIRQISQIINKHSIPHCYEKHNDILTCTWGKKKTQQASRCWVLWIKNISHHLVSYQSLHITLV